VAAPRLRIAVAWSIGAVALIAGCSGGMNIANIPVAVLNVVLQPAPDATDHELVYVDVGAFGTRLDEIRADIEAAKQKGPAASAKLAADLQAVVRELTRSRTGSARGTWLQSQGEGDSHRWLTILPG
jgi:hypothetical protein